MSQSVKAREAAGTASASRPQLIPSFISAIVVCFGVIQININFIDIILRNLPLLKARSLIRHESLHNDHYFMIVLVL